MIEFIKKYDWKNKDVNIKRNIEVLLNKTLGMFKYTGLPDTIPQDELEKILLINGYGVITEVEGNLYIFRATEGGERDVYGGYKNYIVNNPYIKFNKTLTPGKDCELIKSDSLGVGLSYLLGKYATLINECEISLVMGVINNRLQTLISAGDNKTIESARQFLKDLELGKLGVIAETPFLESLKFNTKTVTQDLKSLFELHQYIKSCFYNEIGLGSQSNFKKERLVTSEITFNFNNIYALIDDMIETRREGLEKINTKYNLNITVEFDGVWKDRNTTDTNPDTDTDTTQDTTQDTDTDTTQDTDKTQDTDTNPGILKKIKDKFKK